MSFTKIPPARAGSLCFHNDEYFKAASDCSLARPVDKNETTNERALVATWWDDMVKNRGQKVAYYVNTFNINEDDKLYAEAPNRKFHGPKEMILGIKLQNIAIPLQMTGFVNDSEITAFITFSAFEDAFEGDEVYESLFDDIEPKAGDIFCMTEFGNDRPGKRGPLYFEVTSRTDEDIETINQLGGHYVWMIKAKKLEYSFEPGLNIERTERVVVDNDIFGLAGESNSDDATPPKPYYFDVNDRSAEVNIDQKTSAINNVYGGY